MQLPTEQNALNHCYPPSKLAPLFPPGHIAPPYKFPPPIKQPPIQLTPHSNTSHKKLPPAKLPYSKFSPYHNHLLLQIPLVTITPCHYYLLRIPLLKFTQSQYYNNMILYAILLYNTEKKRKVY